MLKLLEEKCNSTLPDKVVGKDFLNRTLFPQELRPAIDKWKFPKLKCFCTDKQSAGKMEVNRMEKNLCKLYILHRIYI